MKTASFEMSRIYAEEVTRPQARLSASELRRELSRRNLMMAQNRLHETTIGEVPSVLYQEIKGEHGNFLTASYRRICAAPDWRRRLEKPYTAKARVPRPNDRIRRELDCANSSDALLMNVFCYPGVLSRSEVCSLLGIERGLRPRFGVRPGAPFSDGGRDRTEIDMCVGHLFIESKLTEGGFQTARRELVFRYRELQAVFDVGELPLSGGLYQGYQLIRGVLAAHHAGRSFLVLCDGRRDDLREGWFRILRAVHSCELRSRLAIVTWQELSCALPPKLKRFLLEKYGVEPAASII